MWGWGVLRWFWRLRGGRRPELLDGDTMWAYFVISLLLLIALSDCAAHGAFD